MAYIILPSRWTRQPSAPVRVSAEFRHGIAACIHSFLGPVRDIVNGLPPVSGTGTRADTVQSYGRARQYTDGSDFFTPPASLSAPSSYSVLVRANISAFGVYSGFFNKTASTSTNTTGFGSYTASGAGPYWSHNDSTFVTLESFATSITTAGLTTLVVTWDGAQLKYYRGGALITDVALATAVTTGDGHIKVLSNRDTSTTTGFHEITAVWANRVLSSAEVYALNRNPYLMFAPIRRRIYFNTAAGGATTVNVGATTHSYTARAPQVKVKVQPAQVVHTYTARAPQVKAQVKPAQVTHSYTAVAPQVKARVQPAAVTHTYAGQTPTVLTGTSVAAPAVTHTYTTQAPQVKASVQPGVVTHTYTGQVPTVLTGNAIAAPTVTHTHTAVAPQVRAKVQPAQVVHTYTARAPQVKASVMPGAVSHTYTGVAATLLANLEIAVPVASHSYGLYAPTISDGSVQARRDTGAGSSKRKRLRRRTVVEIDGQLFDVQTEEDAEALIEQAKTIAEQQARAEAERVVKKRRVASRREKKPLKLAPIELAVPQVKSADTEFSAELQRELDAVYEAAARDAELALHMHVERVKDEEDAIILLLLS